MSSTPLPSIGPKPLSDEEIKQKLDAFDNIPLFMKTLPDEETDDSAISALQSLAYAGTPDENAQNFKEQGNDYFKGKRYREALGFYTQGIDEKPTDNALREALLCNRAACNLELQNYGSVLRDCSKALTVNPKSAKAYYRSASALLALERFDEGLDCCDRCLGFEPQNKGIAVVRGKLLQGKEKKEKKEREREERLRQERDAKRKLAAAFKARNLIVLPGSGTEINPHAPKFDKDDATGETMIFPVSFAYPQHAMADMITDFVEDVPFASHLATMFPPNEAPPSWDVNREYVDSNLAVYAPTHRKRLLKVGKKATLRDVFRMAKNKEGEPKDGLELHDGCLTFVVVPKGEVEKKWVQDFKASL